MTKKKTIKTFGDRLRHLREENHMRQIDVCERTKLSASFLSDLENGKRQPSAANLCLLAEVFHVTMGWLFTGGR